MVMGKKTIRHKPIKSSCTTDGHALSGDAVARSEYDANEPHIPRAAVQQASLRPSLTPFMPITPLQLPAYGAGQFI